MKHYVIRKTEKPYKGWQVIRSDKARMIAGNAPTEEEAARAYNTAATLTLKTRKAALSFIKRIGGTWE